MTHEDLILEITRMQHQLSDSLVKLKKGELHGQAKISKNVKKRISAKHFAKTH